MKSITLRAPATSANVGPGYDIFALALDEPYDILTLTLNDSREISIEITGKMQNIPVSVDDNTGGLALKGMFESMGIKQGVKILLHKNMTSGSGLGTTGASAAACVYGINKLLELKLSDNELIDFARKGEIASGGSPHADNVAAAMLGGFTLVTSYNPLNVIKLDIPDIPVVLAVIRKSIRTTRGFITYAISEEKLKEQIARCSTVIHMLHTQNIKGFGDAINTDHIAEPVRGASIQGYYDVKKSVLDAGAYGCTISGGGSSVIAFCPKEKQDEIETIMFNAFSSNGNFAEIVKTRTSNIGVTEI